MDEIHLLRLGIESQGLFHLSFRGRIYIKVEISGLLTHTYWFIPSDRSNRRNIARSRLRRLFPL